MKLSPRQREVIEKMRDGWELRQLECGIHKLRSPVMAITVPLPTIQALKYRELICLVRTKDYSSRTYALTPAGREAVEG